MLLLRLPIQTLTLKTLPNPNPKPNPKPHLSITPKSHLSTPLLRLAPFLLPHRDPILKAWLCSAASVFCLSKAASNVGKLAAAPEKIVEVGVPALALGLASCVGGYLREAFLWEAALGAVCGVREYVFGRVLERELGFFEGSDGVSAGDVACRITAEAGDVADALFALLNMVVPSILQVVVMATQMVSLSPALSLASSLVIPCLCFIIAQLGENLRKISQNAHASAARLSSYLNEILPSMLVVKANNAEVKERLRFQNLLKDDLHNILRKRKMKAFIPQMVQALGIGGLIVLCTSYVLLSRGSFDCSVIFSFVTSLALLVEPIKSLGKAYNELKQGEPAVTRLFDLAKFSSEALDNPHSVDLETVQGDIKFCNVTFKYGGNMPFILNGLDLHVNPGETIALVGPSGGGKTTLMKLLLNLYSPFSGCILLDDHDIQNIQLRSLRKHISLVSQDIMLFTGTIAENIAYKDSLGKIDMDCVENAAKIANADEFIAKLPDCYETNVGPKGSRLSGGQRQRLAIARALYQKSSVLVLDEATSALDSTSELLVRHALERLMVDHTMLVIAHRLETVLMADRILFLEGGRAQEMSRSDFLAQVGGHGSQLPSDFFT